MDFFRRYAGNKLQLFGIEESYRIGGELAIYRVRIIPNKGTEFSPIIGDNLEKMNRWVESIESTSTLEDGVGFVSIRELERIAQKKAKKIPEFKIDLNCPPIETNWNNNSCNL